jgi:hypothetical protein
MKMKFKAEFIVDVDAESPEDAHDFITEWTSRAKLPNRTVIDAVVLLGEGEEPEEVQL